jgi:hypothetical protein
MLGAWFLIMYSDFFRNVLTNPLRSPFFVGLSGFCLVASLALLFYLSCFLPFYRGIEDPWDKFPVLIYALTGLGIGTGLFFIMGMWSVWGIVTPIIVFVLFMAFWMPWCVFVAVEIVF